MTLNAKSTGDIRSKFNPLESGTYPARLLNVIDCGLQAQRPYQGQLKKPQPEILVTYELNDEFMSDEAGDPDESKPRQISEYFPFYSLGAELAKSTKRYNALDPTGEFDGDWTKLIGLPIMLTIVQSPDRKDPTRIYENPTALSTMRSKDVDKLSEMVGVSKLFDIDKPDMDAFNGLAPWMQKKIVANLEFEGSDLQKLISGIEIADVEDVDTPESSLGDLAY
jgi:hypothetical protein|tara:strand:- start:168 stop:836 length:669 start_codon:yes stop_codon:yes gene_type:complete